MPGFTTVLFDDAQICDMHASVNGFAHIIYCQCGSGNIKAFANIPVSIILGIILGAIVGYLLYLFFETAYAKKHYVRNSMKGNHCPWIFFPADRN